MVLTPVLEEDIQILLSIAFDKTLKYYFYHTEDSLEILHKLNYKKLSQFSLKYSHEATEMLLMKLAL